MLSSYLNRKYTSLSIQTKVIIFSFILIGGVGIAAYHFSIGVVSQKWIESRKIAGLALAADQASKIDELINREAERLTIFSHYFLHTVPAKGSIMSMLRAEKSRSGQERPLVEFVFMSLSGNIEQAGSERLLGPHLVQALREHAYMLSMQKNSRVAQGMLISSFDEKGLLLGEPCLAVDGKYLGIVAAYLPSSQIFKVVSSLTDSDNHDCTMSLVDTSGRVLSTANKTTVLNVGRKTLSFIASGTESGSFYTRGDVYSFARTKSVPLYVVVHRPAGALDSELEDVRRMILVIGAGSLIILLLLSLWTVKTLTTPVRELVEATRTVASGEFRPIEAKLSGEAGELIDAFNAIGETLNRNYRRLSIVNSLSSALVSDIRETDIGQRVVEAVSASLNVSACALLLPNEVGELKVASMAGGKECGIVGSIQWNDIAWLSRIGSSGSPVIDNSLRSPEVGSVGCGDSVPICKAMAVPMPSTDKPAGILAAFNCVGSLDFTQNDLELLSACANNAAVAIQNSVYFHRTEDDLDKIRRLKDELIQSEKMAAIGQLVSGVAHELNNPMGVIMGYAELLGQLAETDRIHLYTTRIWEAAQRASGILKNLLVFSRKHPHKTQPVALNDVIMNVLELLSHPLKLENVHVICELDQDLPNVMGDAQELQQVFLNLVTNAMQAMEDTQGARLIIHTSNRNGLVSATISDNGPGIPTELHSRIFEPFFTTKPIGKGTGLGLSICYGIVTDIGGTMRLESGAGRGTSFVIELPAAPPSSERVENHAVTKSYSVVGLRVLVVDDESDVREVISEILRSAGCRVTSADTGRAALSTLSQVAVDAIVTDLRMPGMDGMDFFKTCVKLYPHYAGRFIFVSGDTSGDRNPEFIQVAGGRLLHKPFKSDELTVLLEEVAADTK